MLARETFRIEFDMGPKVPFPFGDSRVFRTVSRTNISSAEHAFEVPAFVIDGKLIIDKQSGQSVRITYARNRVADEYVRLLVKLDGHESVELFRAFLYNQEGY